MSVSGLDLTVFFRSLATLQGAGVPLASSFETLACSVESKALAQICELSSRMLAQGHTVSNCFRQFPKAFSAFHVHLIAVGEQTGTLNKVLLHIATFEESRQRLRQRVQSALIYPTVVAVLALLGLVFVLPFVMDGIFEVLRDSGGDLPLLTQLVMGVSSLMSNPLSWLVILAVGAGLYRPAKRALTGSRLRPFLLNLPGLGNCLRSAGAARFAGALSLCLRSGLNLQRSLALSALATGDPLLVERVPGATKSIEQGSSISGGLASIEFFSPLFLEIVASGEEVGRTEELLGWLARTMERDLEQELQTYASLLEPLMLLAVGLIVGVIVIATATPMLNLIQTLG